jgi:hypothetical protein
MAKTNNPANPENNGTLPAKKLYTQDEVDALLANKSKIALLWTNPDPTSAFAAQTITVNNLKDYDYALIVLRADYGIANGDAAARIVNTDDTTTSYVFTFCARARVSQREMSISGNNLVFAGAYYVPLYGSETPVALNGDLKPVLIFGIKL